MVGPAVLVGAGDARDAPGVTDAQAVRVACRSQMPGHADAAEHGTATDAAGAVFTLRLTRRIRVAVRVALLHDTPLL
ncbi:hypothetical protein ASD86_01505 [Lysobacter sp. Root690]|nr:hypothetical protein ASD86_01505 [Lysobacter sp. Root690]